MATNLRLRPDAAEALKAEATRLGRSQQDVIRAAVDAYLSSPQDGHAVPGAAPSATAPRKPWARPSRRVTLPKNASSLDLLDRDDRI